jgi:hypothetical protein
MPADATLSLATVLVPAAALALTVYLSRATARRVRAALLSGVATAVFNVGQDATARAFGFWSFPTTPTGVGPVEGYVAVALWYGAALALISWRLDRRFGWRGPAGVVAFMTVFGPFRDYTVATATGLIVFAPGALPLLFDAGCYFTGIGLNVLVMRWVGGPARADALRRPRAGVQSSPLGAARP